MLRTRNFVELVESKDEKDLQQLDVLLQRKKKLTDWQRDYYNREALSVAITSDNLAAVELFLKHGANANDIIILKNKSNYSDTLLAYVLKQKNFKMIELLLKYKASLQNALGLVYDRFSERKKQFSSAINSYGLDSVKKIEYSQQLNLLIQEYQAFVSTLLDYAVGADFNEYFFEYIKNIDLTDMNFIGVSVAGEMIDHDRILKEKFITRPMFTLIDLERISADRKIRIKKQIDYLFEHRGKLITTDGLINFISFDCAITTNYAAVIKRLEADAAIDINEKIPESKIPLAKLDYPIVLAIKKQQWEIAEFLLNHINISSASLRAALYTSLSHANETFSKKILQKYPVNSVDENGASILHDFAKTSRTPAIQFLLTQGADINLTDKELCTPLHYAAGCWNVDAVQFLIDNNAKRHLKNKNDLDAKDYAKEKYENYKNSFDYRNLTTQRFREELEKCFQDTTAAFQKKSSLVQHREIWQNQIAMNEEKVVSNKSRGFIPRRRSL